jgi:hypothetical protein
MKKSRFCVLVLLSLLCTALAFADGVNDPKIVIRGVQGGGTQAFSHCPPEGCTNVGLNFSFSTPPNGRGSLFFTNASGQNWTSLKLIEKGVPAEAISCSQSLFLSCSVKTLKDGSVEILLAGVKGRNARNGIPNGANFLIDFAPSGDRWPGNLNFTAHASAAPEPGTIALVATGIGALVSRRKRWKKSLKA